MEAQEEYVEQPEEEAVETQEPTENVEQADSEDVEDTATSPAESDAEEEPEQKKSKGGFQKRIDELTKRYYEEHTQRQQIERELEELRRQQVDTQHQSAKPRFDDYTDPDQYERDLAQWYEQGIQRQQEAQKQAQEEFQKQQEQAQRSAELQRKVVEAAGKYSDFNEVVMNPELPPLAQVNPHAFEALTESEKFADVAYFLAKNPHEIVNFQGLSPVKAAYKIAQIEQKVSKPKQSKPSKAPSPPPKVGSESEASEDLSKVDDIEEWMRRRSGQLQSRG